MISAMTTTRSQQRYDHRLRELVHRTGDLTIATDLFWFYMVFEHYCSEVAPKLSW
jgi:hypothetical protein